MTWHTRYLPPDPNCWQGRADLPQGSCFFQIMQMLDLRETFLSKQNKQAFALIGFSCDEGVRRNLGRTGAFNGPAAIREILGKFSVQKTNLICYDAGDVTCTDGNLESAQKALAEACALLLLHNITPIVLGGGHELAYGHYLGIAKKFTKEKIGIVNFDAHFDMRPLRDEAGSSGTPFLQIAKTNEEVGRHFDYNCIGIQTAGNIPLLFEIAKKYGVHTVLADDLHQGNTEKCAAFVARIIDENDVIYLSLCLDVFAAPFAPGVSAPQPLGLTPWQVIPLVRQLAASGKVVSYDIAELAPQYDADQRTAKLAANFVYEFIHHSGVPLRKRVSS